MTLLARILAPFALWVLALPAAAAVDIEEVETPAGHTVWLVQEPSIPFVALEIVFRGGTSLDPQGKRGAVNLMTGLLEEGAGEMDAQAFARARDDLAARFEFDASDDGVSVSARFLTETRESAIDLLATALSAPRFDAQAVERVRGQVLSGLRSDAEDPGAVASRAFGARVYPEGHPYATPGEGTVDSVTALTREDLAAAHAAALARDRVFVGAAGDISPEAVGRLVDRLLADLPAEGAPMPEEAQLSFDGATEVVEFDTPQSVIMFGQPGIDRHDPDFFAAYILNQILGGGGFGSRLMEEVREKRGLTYGIYSYLAGKDHADLLVGRAATANARAGETVSVVRDEWARMASEGPTEDELATARTYLIDGYPLRFDGNAAIARILVGMQLDGLATDYPDTRNDRIRAVTHADIRRVAGELLQPEALSFVVVGRPEGLPPAD